MILQLWDQLWNISCYYCKNPKNMDTWKICCNHPYNWTTRLYHRVMLLKDADGIANNVDPDQTAPLGAVWSRSALFAQAYLSKNLGSLRYCKNPNNADTRKIAEVILKIVQCSFTIEYAIWCRWTGIQCRLWTGAAWTRLDETVSIGSSLCSVTDGRHFLSK